MVPECARILNALSTGKIKEFFNENPGDYTTLGLDKPFIDVSLTYGKDKAIKHLIIGLEKSRLKKRAENRRRGRQGSRSERRPRFIWRRMRPGRICFSWKRILLTSFTISPNDVRDKTLASIQRWDVDSIELTNPKGSFSFRQN